MTGSPLVAAPVAALEDQAAHEPARVVLVAQGRSWTAAEVADETAALAAGLVAAGAGPRSRVALHLWNTSHAALAYLACLRVGATVVPLNPRLTTAELSDLVERTQPVLYVGAPDLHDVFADVPETLVPASARFLTAPGHDHAGLRSWEELRGGPHAPAATTDPDVPALLLSTSGTTGPSKLAVWSYRTLEGLPVAAAGRGIAEGDVLPVMTPLMHGAAVYHLLNAVTQRATAVLIARFDAAAVLDAMQAWECTTVFGLPFMCAELAREQRSRPRDLHALRLATVAGDVCPPDVEALFQEVFALPLPSYWAAAEDVGPTVPTGGPGPFMELVPQASVSIVDPDGHPVHDGEVGEMLISSPTSSPGYWQSGTEITPHPHGVVHTGDLVRRVDGPVLEYVGRAKELIVRGGSNISPAEVEQALRGHPGVLDAAVTGLPDADLGERVGAALVMDAQAGATVEEVLRDVGRSIAGYKLPERTVEVDEIPRNSLTKIDRQAARALFEDA